MDENAYRGADDQPVIPVDAAQDASLDVEAQGETDGADRHGDKLHDDESRTPSLRVDVVWSRPRGQDFGGRVPHVGGRRSPASWGEEDDSTSAPARWAEGARSKGACSANCVWRYPGRGISSRVRSTVSWRGARPVAAEESMKGRRSRTRRGLWGEQGTNTADAQAAR